MKHCSKGWQMEKKDYIFRNHFVSSAAYGLPVVVLGLLSSRQLLQALPYLLHPCSRPQPTLPKYFVVFAGKRPNWLDEGRSTVARMERSAIRDVRGRAFPVFRFAAYGLRFCYSSPALFGSCKSGGPGMPKCVARMERSAIREFRSRAIPVFRFAAYGLQGSRLGFVFCSNRPTKHYPKSYPNSRGCVLRLH